jgi:prevent-host-death family protein
MQHWTVRDAKDHLSRLIGAAQAEPQAITKRGRDCVVVLSRQEYDRLLRTRKPLSEFFEHGLEGVEIERIKAAMRDEGDL